MWDFTKRFGSGWVGIALAIVTIAGGFVVTFDKVEWGYLVLAALVITVVASYRLFKEQEEKITKMQDEVWSARHGTNALVKIKGLPVEAYQSGDLLLQNVYLVNRRKDHTANLRFTLIGGDVRLEAAGTENDGTRLGMDLLIPNPKHLDPGDNRGGYLRFPIGELNDLTLFVVEGVQLEVRDEQTGFTAEIDLPTGPDGVELIQRREVADGVGNV